MSTFRTPVGPQPSGVYWRRRLVVGLGLLAVIVIILLIIFQPRGTPQAGPSDTQSSAPSAEPTMSAEEPCSPSVIDITAATDKNSYAPGENPQITLTVTNRGAAACTFNAGTSQQEYLITSGDELYWTSKHCQSGAEDAQVVLQPNKGVSTAPIMWDRTRSDPSTCDATRPAVPGGGASYHLNINVGDLASNDVQFILN